MVHKLYSMVRSGKLWTLGEPELNDSGLPVIHDIASKLGAVRPISDINLPAQLIFPEDAAGMTELTWQMEEQCISAQEALTPRADMDLNNFNLISAQPTASTFEPPRWLETIVQHANELQVFISDQGAHLQHLQSQHEQMRQLLAHWWAWRCQGTLKSFEAGGAGSQKQGFKVSRDGTDEWE